MLTCCQLSIWSLVQYFVQTQCEQRINGHTTFSSITLQTQIPVSSDADSPPAGQSSSLFSPNLSFVIFDPGLLSPFPLPFPTCRAELGEHRSIIRARPPTLVSRTRRRIKIEISRRSNGIRLAAMAARVECWRLFLMAY
jgi:hypothetical protein